jgi:hypothetical protein
MIKYLLLVALISTTFAFVETPNYAGNSIVSSETTQNDMNELKALLEACPDLQMAQYRVEPYLKAAIYLQNKGEQDAIALLKDFAANYTYENQIIVLCRMLFEKKENGEFRRPMIGGAVFFGATDYDDWLKEPIEIVDGIPFVITRGYFLGGLPESAAAYLEYCEDNCQWNELIYILPSQDEKEGALKKILELDKWIEPLSQYDVQFFMDQL